LGLGVGDVLGVGVGVGLGEWEPDGLGVGVGVVFLDEDGRGVGSAVFVGFGVGVAEDLSGLGVTDFDGEGVALTDFTGSVGDLLGLELVVVLLGLGRAVLLGVAPGFAGPDVPGWCGTRLAVSEATTVESSGTEAQAALLIC
jgi:hypothetical protein